MSIRIGCSPTGIKLEVTKGDRRAWNHNEKYMVTFHSDHFVFTPESHSSFVKGQGTKVNRIPNGAFIIQTSKITVIDPWDKAMDYPYFKIDYTNRIDNLSDNGIVSVFVPKELKPIRCSSGEKGMGLSPPAGKKRTELTHTTQSGHVVREAVDEEIMITGPMDSAWKEFWEIYNSGARNVQTMGETIEMRRVFMAGWDACRSNILQDQAKPPLLSEVLEEMQREKEGKWVDGVHHEELYGATEPQRAPMDRQLRAVLSNQLMSLELMWQKLNKDNSPWLYHVKDRIDETRKILVD